MGILPPFVLSIGSVLRQEKRQSSIQQAWGSVSPLACVLWLLTYFKPVLSIHTSRGDDDSDRNSLSEHLLRGSRSQFQVLHVSFLIFRCEEPSYCAGSVVIISSSSSSYFFPDKTSVFHSHSDSHIKKFLKIVSFEGKNAKQSRTK